MDNSWADTLNPRSLYGAGGAAGAPPSSQAPTGLQSAVGAGVDEGAPVWSPDNGLFWLFLIAGVTVGLIGFNANFRVGPFKAGGSAGKE